MRELGKALGANNKPELISILFEFDDLTSKFGALADLCFVAGHLTQFAFAHRAGAVEGDHMVHLGANADPLAQLMVVVAGHMGHQQLAADQTQGIQKL